MRPRLTGEHEKPQSDESTVDLTVTDSPGWSVVAVPLAIPIGVESTVQICCLSIVAFALVLLAAFDVTLLWMFKVEPWKVIRARVLSCVPSATEGVAEVRDTLRAWPHAEQPPVSPA